jgi:hypothetical protein
VNQPPDDQFRSLFSRGDWDRAGHVLERLDPNVAADQLMSLPYETQQLLFQKMSVEFAAKLAPIFPYYHTYVLLHSRPQSEMAAIVDRMDPAERLMFFDELPEQAWQQLTDELARKAPPARFRGQTFTVTGLGATISRATDSGNSALLVCATLAMSALVVTINRLVWRRLYALAATRFNLET